MFQKYNKLKDIKTLNTNFSYEQIPFTSARKTLFSKCSTFRSYVFSFKFDYFSKNNWSRTFNCCFTIIVIATSITPPNDVSIGIKTSFLRILKGILQRLIAFGREYDFRWRQATFMNNKVNFLIFILIDTFQNLEDYFFINILHIVLV